MGGLVGLLLPIVPGWLLIIPGLAILGTEFVWARRLLDTAKAKATDLKAKIPTEEVLEGGLRPRAGCWARSRPKSQVPSPTSKVRQLGEYPRFEA